MISYLDNKPLPPKPEEEEKENKEAVQEFFDLPEIQVAKKKALKSLESDLNSEAKLAEKLAHLVDKPLTDKEKDAIEIECFLERITQTYYGVSSKKREGIFRQPRPKT